MWLKSLLVQIKDPFTLRVNVMFADDLATLGAQASSAKVLTQFSWNITTSAQKV